MFTFLLLSAALLGAASVGTQLIFRYLFMQLNGMGLVVETGWYIAYCSLFVANFVNSLNFKCKYFLLSVHLHIEGGGRWMLIFQHLKISFPVEQVWKASHVAAAGVRRCSVIGQYNEQETIFKIFYYYPPLKYFHSTHTEVSSRYAGGTVNIIIAVEIVDISSELSTECPWILESTIIISDDLIKRYKLTVKFLWYLFLRLQYHTVTLLHFLSITMILFECSPSAFANNNFTTPSHGLQLMTWALGHDTASVCSVLDLHWSLRSDKCK